MQFYEKTIVVDADGVFLNFMHSYDLWMYENGNRQKNDCYSLDSRYGLSDIESDLYFKMFTESAAISNLPPYRDSIKYIKKLHEEHGFVFHCITAIPNIPSVVESRWKNIRNIFGNTAFERLTLSDTAKNKKQYLEKYRDSGCFWIEDSTRNVVMGHEMGLQGVLMSNEYNKEFYHKEIPVVHSWKEIYELIVGV